MIALIVDDEEHLRTVARLALTVFGKMQVLEAGDGRTALDVARNQNPDVILLDVWLPDMSGTEVLARLRADDATRDIPVFFLTGFTRPSELAELRAAGPSGILTKPFDPARLARDVEERMAALPPRT